MRLIVPLCSMYYDWQKESLAKEENIQDIIARARKKAERDGLIQQSDGEENYQPHPTAPSSAGKPFATVARVKELVEVVRRAYWKRREAPFPHTREGFEAAKEWLLQKELEGGTSRAPDKYRIELVMEGRGIPQFFNALKASLARTSGSDRLLRIAEAIVEAQRSAVGEITHVNSGVISHPMLELGGTAGVVQNIHAPEGSLLGALYKSVEEVRKASEWWSPSQALNHIMTGHIPRADPKVSWSERGDKNYSITLTIDPPATEQEVLNRYRFALEQIGHEPKTLTLQQSAMLQLVYETPGLTWEERHELWKQRCEVLNSKSDARFTMFQNWRNFRHRCIEASKRTSLY